MYQIVYSSRARIMFAESDLIRLCDRSVVNNREAGVTGLLLYDGLRFLQALEGDRAMVLRAMDRIIADRRHGNFDYLANGPVERRHFGQWNMQYKPAASGCCSRDFLERVKADVTAVEDAALRAAFIGFASLASNRPVGYRCSALAMDATALGETVDADT